MEYRAFVLYRSTYVHLIQVPNRHAKDISAGVFQSHPYLTYQNDHRFFVSLDKLWFEPKVVGVQEELQSQQSAGRQQLIPQSYPMCFTVCSRVQISTYSSVEPFKYGIIRWIGKIPPMQGLVAGIEMVSILYSYYV